MIYPVDRYGILGKYGQKLCREICCSEAKWFRHAESACLLAHDLIDSLKPKQYDGQGIVTATLFVRGLSQSQSVFLLCANGMPNEARIVLRSLLELVIYLRSIHVSKWLMWHYLKQHDRERIRMVNKVGRSEFLQNKWPGFDLASEKAQILQGLGDAKDGPTLELYSEAAGMKDLYHTAYTVFCGAVHTGAQDLQTHLDATTPDKLKEIRYGVSDEDIQTNLITLAELILMAIEPVMDRFCITPPSNLESLREEHRLLGKEITEQGVPGYRRQSAPQPEP